uniref:Uncharacterized protein n=1 Tax=Glossina palpalis gambiensis TaxID=67801 RepID=A0A1B0BY12_9MUSC
MNKHRLHSRSGSHGPIPNNISWGKSSTFACAWKFGCHPGSLYLGGKSFALSIGNYSSAVLPGLSKFDGFTEQRHTLFSFGAWHEVPVVDGRCFVWFIEGRQWQLIERNEIIVPQNIDTSSPVGGPSSRIRCMCNTGGTARLVEAAYWMSTNRLVA